MMKLVLTILGIFVVAGLVGIYTHCPKVVQYNFVGVDKKHHRTVIDETGLNCRVQKCRWQLSREEMQTPSMVRTMELLYKAEGKGNLGTDLVVSETRRVARFLLGEHTPRRLRGGSSAVLSASGSRLGMREMTPKMAMSEYLLAVYIHVFKKSDRDAIVYAEICSIGQHIGCSIAAQELFGNQPQNDRQRIILASTPFSTEKKVLVRRATNLCKSLKQDKKLKLNIQNCAFSEQDFVPQYHVLTINQYAKVDGRKFSVTPTQAVPLIVNLQKTSPQKGIWEITISNAKNGEIISTYSNNEFVLHNIRQNTEQLGSVSKILPLICATTIPESQETFGRSLNQKSRITIDAYADKTCLRDRFGVIDANRYATGRISMNSIELHKHVASLLKHKDANVRSAIKAAAEPYGTASYIKPAAEKLGFQVLLSKTGTVALHKNAATTANKGNYGGLLVFTVKSNATGEIYTALIRLHATAIKNDSTKKSETKPICRQRGCLKPLIKAVALETLNLISSADQELFQQRNAKKEH